MFLKTTSVQSLSWDSLSQTDRQLVIVNYVKKS